MPQARKWRQFIKCEGKPLGDWLLDKGYAPIECSQKVIDCSQIQDNLTPGNVSGHDPDNSSCMQQTPLFDVPVVNTREKKQSTPLPNFELTQFMIDLETKLLQSLRELIQHAVESLREHIEVELHGFKKKIETLS